MKDSDEPLMENLSKILKKIQKKQRCFCLNLFIKGEKFDN
jgi:hypothetical protein